MFDNPIQKYACFADESGITVDRHSIVGCTVAKSSRLAMVYKAIADVRDRHDLRGELKWSKVSGQKLEAYMELVRAYFLMVDQGKLSFHATTFDNNQWDHKRYNQDDPDIGLSKLYYQMLLHQVIAKYGDLGTLFICLDRRKSSTTLDDLHRILNHGAGKEYGLTFGPVRVLVSKDSKKDDVLQINDVILGAVSSVKNGRNLDPGARPAKQELGKLVLQLSGLKSYDNNSPLSKKDFTIWNRSPR